MSIFFVQGVQDIIPFSRDEAPPFIVTELDNLPGSLAHFLAENKVVLTRWVRTGSTEDLRQSLLRYTKAFNDNSKQKIKVCKKLYT